MWLLLFPFLEAHSFQNRLQISSTHSAVRHSFLVKQQLPISHSNRKSILHMSIQQ
uniref:Uncharacterized protein n=1 Tax=Anguilla anguilla TaxID=7936 RepID=A0A0E9SVR2_ANGAN